MMKLRLLPSLMVSLCLFLMPQWAAAQTGAQTGSPASAGPTSVRSTGILSGAVVDPSGADIPGASVTLTLGSQVLSATSGPDGRYAFRTLAPGTYTLTVTANGFTPFTISQVHIAAGATKELNLPMVIQVEKQQVTVQADNQGVSLDPDQNANSMVIKGGALDALSDDPDELQSELQALAGPAAGPNGGQIYIDGFEGGQLPPKSAILEIHVNQNPFSAEYDRIGYGRIEIITKPGSEKLKGSAFSFGNDSSFNTANPLIAQQPDYYIYGTGANISGPLTKTSAYFFDFFRMSRQNQVIIDALNPQTLQNFSEPYPDPSSMIDIEPRIDFELGKNNMLTVRDEVYRSSQSGSGVGTLNLQDQATSGTAEENTLQIGDTMLVNPRLVNEARFQWRRIRNSQSAEYPGPAVSVQGAFTTGGNSSGVNQDHEDVLQLQDYSTATFGPHTLRFGTRLRTYRDANLSTSGSNGTYTFALATDYQAQTPSQYSATLITNPLARVLLFDGAVFFEDDWRVNSNFNLGLGLRFEGQNRIHDHADWAPRLSMAWSPKHTGTNPPKTVIRAGYGWFYNRFTVPNFFGSAAGAPYVAQAIHNNLINQTSYVIDNPCSVITTNCFNSSDPITQPAKTVETAPTTTPSYTTIDPHFHAALDMQGGIGVDRQITKKFTANVTYLFTQGVHQYLTDDVTAPAFDAATYTVTGAAPSVFNNQFQSGCVYRQNQLIFTGSLQLKRLTLNGFYMFNQANSDTQGVTSQPSVAQDPGLDYGRAGFGIRHRITFLDSFTAPHGIVIASYFAAQSGTPYNLTIGQDLTGNNQFNARPTYGTCGAAGVIQTQYGCLDTDPAGKGEAMVPYDLGTGPANAVFHLRVSKVIGIGPRIKEAGEGNSFHGGNSVSGRGLSGGGAAIRLDAAAPRRYNLTLVAGANNLFNIVNLGTPNGVLKSPLFGQTQQLAGGQFGEPTPGNRSIFLQTRFSF
jgi:hypothetical protein